jgi:peptide/nickel transport system permease protein
LILIKKPVLFRKKTYYSSGSLSVLAWRKFRKNGPGFISLHFIVIAVIIATLGYIITPDSTPFANDQCIELGTQKPGYSTTFLLVRKNQGPERPGFIERMIWGRKSEFTAVPIQHYYFSGKDIIVDESADSSDRSRVQRSFNIADVLYPLGTDTSKIRQIGNTFQFRLINGRELTKSIDDMQKEIVLNSIVKKSYFLGTDRFGRDLLSQLIIGTRVSLSVGLISVAISLIVGIFLGALGGYFRGWIDHFIVWFINVVWSIPTLLLVIAITFALGKGFWQVFVAVGLTMWVEVARVVRGQMLGIREKEYVEAGKAMGFSDFRIIFRHILPNITGVIIVISAANFASAILLEAGLSFLGIGVQPPMPSWGSMIKENYGYIILDSAYLAILPGLAIMLMVLAFMLVGNALRDALDVKSSEI